MAMMKTLLEGDFYSQVRQAMSEEINDAVIKTFRIPTTLLEEQNHRWYVSYKPEDEDTPEQAYDRAMKGI